jgi:hypothetical protein
VVHAAAVDAQVGVFLVEGVALAVEILQGLAFGHYYAAGIEVLNAFFNKLEIQIKVNDCSGFGEVLHCAVAVNDGAAGCDDGILYIEAEDVAFLDSAKLVESFFINDFLKAFVFNGLNINIGIEKIARKRFCQKYSDSTFADSAHADENNVAVMLHIMKAEYLRLSFYLSYLWHET